MAEASVLISLSACDSQRLLEALFGNVIVPEAVFFEVAGTNKPQSERLKNYLQGKICTVNMNNFVYMDAYADAGETQAKHAGLIPHIETLITKIAASPIFKGRIDPDGAGIVPREPSIN